MSDEIEDNRPRTADLIEDALGDVGLIDDELALVLGTAPDVVTSICDGSLPVPLAWIPSIASTLKLDSARLMELALGEQWFPILRAMAASLLWQQRDIEREWIHLIAELHDGIVPDPVDVPDVIMRLKGYRDN